MAKKSKGKLQTRKEKRRPAARRQERRFIAHTSTSPMLVYALGGLSAILLGAGAYGMIYAQSLGAEDALKNLPSYLVAVGAVVLGITIWIGTTAEATVRVGDPGIAIEKGELRRMPWWAIDKITFDDSAIALVVTGNDEASVPWTLKLGVKRHPEAIAWLVHEAAERIPRRLQIDDDTRDKLPAAESAREGEKLELEPLQVVGKRCAATNKIVSYEPDARVCRRCERVYLRTNVPKKCKCGNSLLDLRPKDATDDAGEAPDSGTELESEEPQHASDANQASEANEERASGRDKAIETADG